VTIDPRFQAVAGSRDTSDAGCVSPAVPFSLDAFNQRASISRTIYAERVLRAGARGYVMKKEPSEKIFSAIAEVLRGELAVSHRVKQDMLAFSVSGKRSDGGTDSFLRTLSDREMQVFQLLGEGIPTRAIAERLNLSIKTVETYRENLKLKLNLRDGAALVYRAIQWNRSQPVS